MENIAEYFAHVQTVCTRPLLGGDRPGDEAKNETSVHAKFRIDHVPISTAGTIFLVVVEKAHGHHMGKMLHSAAYTKI